MTKDNPGRPTKMTEETLGKLREAFLMGCTDEEACIYADINPDTLYDYQKKNKRYSEQKELWKKNPLLKARKTLIEALLEPKHAKWYLERKKKDEFGKTIDLTSEGKQIVGFNYLTPKDGNKGNNTNNKT
jgi:hypothetical protein